MTNSPELGPEHYPSTSPEQQVFLDAQAQGANIDIGLHDPYVEAQLDMHEAQDPATEEQKATIVKDATAMVNELPTQRHTEQTDLVGKVDVDQVDLTDISVRHIHGQDSDTTVIEPRMDGASVKIVIDNINNEVFIDDQPVDNLGADKVAGVIGMTRNSSHQAQEVDTVSSTGNSESETVQPEAASMPQVVQADQEPQATPEQLERILQQKRQVLGVVGELLRTRNGDMVLKQLASQLEVEPKELQEKMKKGDITITSETMKALDQLRRDGAQPKSDIWATDPRTGSMLGGAARESQLLLSNLIKNMF